MKQRILFFFLCLVGIQASIFCFLCCVTEQDQIKDVKRQLNKAKPIVIDPQISKIHFLCRYKERHENTTWHAKLLNPFPCVSLEPQANLKGTHDPTNHLLWYEWTIQAHRKGFAQVKLEQYKNGLLHRTQFISVEVKE